MELRQLRYFAAVAETLNFSRAAESLYISQSALSQQVADLERELGVTLLRRNKRSVELTAAGRAMLHEAKAMLQNVEKIVPYIREQSFAETKHRDITIGIDYGVDLNYGSCLRRSLCDIINDMRAETLGLHATFRMFEHEDLIRALDLSAADIGFFLYFAPRLINEGRTQLQSQSLQRDEMVLTVRSEDALEDSPDHVREILLSRGATLLERELIGMSQILRIFDAVGVKPNIRFTNSRNTMVLATESGESVTVFPKRVVCGMGNPMLRMLHFDVPEAECHLLMVWNRDNPNELIPQLVEQLAQSFLD